MNRQIALSTIQSLFARFSAEVSIANAGNMYDVNIHSENILVPLLNKVFGLSLVNANGKQKNFPAVDLVDEANRVAFQVTATSDGAKVKHTLRKFVEHGLHRQFDILYLLILSDKQKKYKEDGYAEIVQGKFAFDKDHHILDLGDLYSRITYSVHDLDRIEQIKMLMEEEFSELKIQERKLLIGAAPGKPEDTELIFPNLLGIRFSDTLYLADLTVELQEQADNYKRHRRGTRKHFDIRTAIHEVADMTSLDWHLFRNKIITFRNLYSEKEPLRKAIDCGTAEAVSSEEFFGTSDSHKSVFKALLGFCLEEKLASKEVEWFDREGVFRFASVQGVPREKAVRWKKENTSKKTVIKEIWNKEQTHIVCFGHLAFRHAFFDFDEQWYLSVSPTWSFTSNGWRRSGFAKEYTAGIKRLEGNKSVYYYFRFWAYFLNYYDIFDPPYAFLQVQSPFSFEFSPVVDDAKWKPEKPEITKDETGVSALVDTELSKNLFD